MPVESLLHYLQIVALGIVEGVTEFLPISSTGHLLIAEALGLGSEPDVFNVVIQAGAILAVIFVYWNKIVGLLTHLENAAGRTYLCKIAAAFATTSVVSLVLIKHFNLHLPETLTPVAWATLIGGFVIFLVELFAKNLYPHDDISWTEAILMGLAQVLAAVFPGASRSGSTIMTGMALGMKRPSATEFSFLLGIPTMFAASALDLWRYRHDLTKGGGQLFVDIVLGFLVSMVVAFFVIKWLLRFVQSHTFNGFGIYRVILGGVLLVALATHALPNMGESDAKKPVSQAARAEAIPTLAPAAAPTTNNNPSLTPTNAGPVESLTNSITTPTDASNAAPANPSDQPAATTNAAPANVPASQ
jgi:undecaprenyl-diphosphatase